MRIPQFTGYQNHSCRNLFQILSAFDMDVQEGQWRYMMISSDMLFVI